MRPEQRLLDSVLVWCDFFNLLDLIDELDRELADDIEPAWREAGYESSIEVWQAEGR